MTHCNALNRDHPTPCILEPDHPLPHVAPNGTRWEKWVLWRAADGKTTLVPK